jgi:hypothetical protein
MVDRYKIRVSKGTGVFKMFVQVPRDCGEVASVLRLVRDLQPRMRMVADDYKTAAEMEESWIRYEREALSSYYDVDAYKLARRPNERDKKDQKERV